MKESIVKKKRITLLSIDLAKSSSSTDATSMGNGIGGTSTIFGGSTKPTCLSQQAAIHLTRLTYIHYSKSPYKHLPVASTLFLCHLHYPAFVCNQPCKALMPYPSIWLELYVTIACCSIYLVMSAEFMEASCSRSCNDGSEVKPLTVPARCSNSKARLIATPSNVSTRST